MTADTRRYIDNLVGGSGMTGANHSGAHNDNDDFEAKPFEPYEVSKDASDVYKSLIKDVFRPSWHKKTTKMHNRAHRKALETLQDKLEGLEKSGEDLDQTKVKEALTHAVIKYKQEAKLPVSDAEEDFHHIYHEVDMLLSEIEKGSDHKISVEQLINKGDVEQLLRSLHENYRATSIDARVRYGLDKAIPQGKEHTFYKEVAKAHLNESGIKLTEGELAGMNRNQLVGQIRKHYDNKIEQYMKEDADRVRRKRYEAHDSHAPAH